MPCPPGNPSDPAIDPCLLFPAYETHSSPTRPQFNTDRSHGLSVAKCITGPLGACSYQPHSTDEEAEAPRGEGTRPINKIGLEQLLIEYFKFFKKLRSDNCKNISRNFSGAVVGSVQFQIVPCYSL